MKVRFFSLSVLAVALGVGLLVFARSRSAAQAENVKAPPLVRSAQSGPWSDAKTWVGRKVPAAGSRVQVRKDHRVVYDVKSDAVIRSIHVAGTLTFAPDRDTRLDVGLINVQAGDDYMESGFDCDAHVAEPDPKVPRPALEVGASDRPIEAKRTALIRLTPVEGLDKQSCPAIVCCGGRMDLHGAPMNRTWVKLGATAKKGQAFVILEELVTGWKVGDKIIVTATQVRGYQGKERLPGKGENRPVATEERVIKSLEGDKIAFDQPLELEHLGEGDFRGAVANLSRNVVVESANLKERGHTMYHKGSAGSIGYAEFRHLGKENVLGRYSLHFHLCGDTMRGSSVIGASIWDSDNRWLTIHGTNYLVVRDCVGYRSVGHGFFLEDGTEVYNVLDRNLAVQAFRGKRLPKQALAFDGNDGAGYWWANSLNTFTRNVACENDRYGFRFEATASRSQKLELPVLQPDGSKKMIDIRTLPFVLFDGNEACCDGLYAFNLGEGVNRVGPDAKRPFVIKNTKLWAVNYGFRVQSPCVLVENMHMFKCNYGIYHPNYDRHVYKNLVINGDGSEPFNRGHDDLSVQHGIVAVDGLTFVNVRGGTGSIPLIQLSDNNATGHAETHVRKLKVVAPKESKRPIVDLGGGPQDPPETPTGVPVFIHDYFAPGLHAKVVSATAKDLGKDGEKYRSEPVLTGKGARVAEVKGVAFPDLVHPVDDIHPQTIITHVVRHGGGKVEVRGTTADDGKVIKVTVNKQQARAVRPNFAEWTITLEGLPTGDVQISAHAEDAAGWVERRPHVVNVAVK